MEFVTYAFYDSVSSVIKHSCCLFFLTCGYDYDKCDLLVEIDSLFFAFHLGYFNLVFCFQNYPQRDREKQVRKCDFLC